MMECKSQLAAGSSLPLGRCQWEETLADGRPEHTALSWLNQGAKVVVSRLRRHGVGGRRMDWRSRRGRIVATQVAKPDSGSTDEKVMPVDRHILGVVHTWSQPCHLPFEQWSVRLVLKPVVWVRVSKHVRKYVPKCRVMLTHVVDVAFEVRWVAYRPRLTALISSVLEGRRSKKKRMRK